MAHPPHAVHPSEVVFKPSLALGSGVMAWMGLQWEQNTMSPLILLTLAYLTASPISDMPLEGSFSGTEWMQPSQCTVFLPDLISKSSQNRGFNV